MNNKLAVVILMASLSTPVLAYQQYQPYQTVNPYGNQQPTLQGSVFMVPAGAEIPALTTSEISTKNMILGQAVSLTLGQDYYYNNKLVAPAGSVVNGTVILLKKGSFAGRNGQLQIKFTSIVSPYGQMIPISGQIKTTDGTGILKGGTAMDTTIDYAKDTAIGAAAGAVGGLVMSAVSGGSIGRGAALGTAIGGGAGVAKSVFDKGGDVVIPANSNVAIQLDQPMTINSASAYRY